MSIEKFLFFLLAVILSNFLIYYFINLKKNIIKIALDKNRQS